MTHNASRKQFFAKLLGVTAAVGLFPKLLAKSSVVEVASSTPVTGEKFPVQVRPETRAVARRADSL